MMTEMRYTPLRRLGRGGTADVILAVQRSPSGEEQHVVIKRLLDHVVMDDEEIARLFVREARLAKCLEHPNIVRVLATHDEARAEAEAEAETKAPFIVMEWLDGVDLRRFADAATPQMMKLSSVLVACAIAADVARALDYAHCLTSRENGQPLGIVHRDVSPQNIFLTRSGEVKLLDFGIASSALQSRAASRSGRMRGKLAYAAPEQVAGLDVDAKTDMFALGIVLWELLTGERLFHRKKDIDTIRAIRESPPIPPSMKLHSPTPGTPIPPELDTLVLRLLTKFPTTRPTAREAIDELDAIVERSAGIATAHAAIADAVKRVAD